MRKYRKKEEWAGKWSDGFTDQKTRSNKKNNKPKQNDDVEFEDGDIVLIDENAVCKSITGSVKMFSFGKGSLKVNGKKIV